MKTFKELLTELNACTPAVDWASDMTIKQVMETCERGDWLGWLAGKIELDKRKCCLAAGHIANQVRHLMKDERSKTAVDVTIAYGEGRATDEELEAARAGARAAARAAEAAWDADAAWAWAAARAAASDAARAAEAAEAEARAAAAEADAASLKSSADIIRKHIGQDIINRVNELLSE
jgi:hypothetical protein